MNLPPIGIESWIFSFLLGFVVCVYIYLMVPIVCRNFIEKDPNRYSNLALLCVLGTIGILDVLPFSEWGFYAVYPVSYWSVFFITVWGGITLIGALVMKQ